MEIGTHAAATARHHHRSQALHDRAAEAFSLDIRFKEEARALRLLLRLQGGSWWSDILEGLDRLHAFRTPLVPAEKHMLDTLLRHHAQVVLLGKFDAEYVASVEELGQFLARHGVSPLAIAGAWNDVRSKLLDLILADDRMADRILRRDAYRSLTGWLAIETALLWHVTAAASILPALD